MRRVPVLLSAATLVGLTLLASRPGTGEPVLHLELVRSVPMADSIVPPPSEVRLWFSEVPLFGSMAIRLIDSEGDLVPAGETVRAPDDGRIYFVRPERPLTPGPYTVSWRAVASDGHASNEEFGFTVRATD